MKGAVKTVASREPNVSSPLILAIQPDRRQASQLASIAKQVSAELVLTESAARAVAVLGERLPDLILTPPLLSHKDEKAITERLQEFGDAGAHIQTLTIPIFETTKAPASKGVLSSLRKSKRKGKAQSAETVGCTAHTFAEQVSIYLSRAIEVRRASPPRQTSSPAPPGAADLQAPPPEQPAPQPEEAAAWQTPAEPPVPRARKNAPPKTPRHTHDTLPTIEELSARTPAVPEPDRSVETRIATIATSVPAVDVTPAPVAAPADTRMEEAITTLVPVVSSAVLDSQVPVPVPARTLVAQLAMELRAAELAASAEHTVWALPALPAASVEATVDVAAMVPVDTAAAEPAAVPLPDATPLALHVDLPSMPLDEAAPERAAVALPDATPLAALHVDLPPADLEAGELAGIPALPPGAIETTIDAVAAMAPFVQAHDDSAIPALASIPHVTPLPTELPSLTATDLHDAASLVFSPPAASVEMNMAAVVPMGAGDDTSMVRVVPVPAATPHVATLTMSLPRDMALGHAAAPPIPEATTTATSMQVIAGFVPSVSAHAELRLPPPAVMAPVDVAMQLSPTDIAVSTSSVLVAPALPAQPADQVSHSLAAIVPLARAAAHHVPVPMPTLVPYVAELPMPLPSVATTGGTNNGVLVVPAPPAAVARTDIDVVAAMMAPVPASTGEPESSPPGPSTALPIRKKTKRQLSLKDRKAARKANRARADRLDESSLFNPDECRFAALVAKLDEVAPGLDESRMASDVAAHPRTRKQKRSPKRR